MNKIHIYSLFAALIVVSGGCAISRQDYSKGLIVKDTKDLVTISSGDKTMLEYRQTSNPNKVYVSKLFTPSGIQVLLDSPHDHIHHHALMYALDSGNNIWWMDGENYGKQVPAGKAKIKKGTITHCLNWNSVNGTTILKEARSITIHKGPGIPATLISWNTALSVAGENPVPMTTTRHYAGLGIRFLRKMDKIGTFVFSDTKNSASVRGTEKVTAANWCAYQTMIDDKPVTVAMFSASSNFRHPTYWFTMTSPFAYISATLNLYRQPHTLLPGTPLDLTYGVAVFDGKQDVVAVEKLYQTWLNLNPEKQAAGDWSKTHVNVATPEAGAKVIGSSVYGPGYEPENVIDGKWAVRETDKWNSQANVTPHFLRIDLGRKRKIDRIKIFHEGVLPDGVPYTTSAFVLQHSTRPWGPWEDLIKTVRGNKEGITEHIFKPVKTRYVRLLIETAEQNAGNAYGRIFEVQVFSKK